jgi:hypothetical protein
MKIKAWKRTRKPIDFDSPKIVAELRREAAKFAIPMGA